MNIDRAIAEKVMGWTEGKESGWPSFKKFTAQEDGKVVIARAGCPSPYSDYWEPSTNIQHAMEVEAEMFRRGFDISYFHHNKEKDTEWEWEVMLTKNKWVKSDQFSKSLPEAICRAALAALEER